MNNIKNLIIRAEYINNQLTLLPSTHDICRMKIDYIPTLQPEICRPASPMLRERYSNFGHWHNATHGDWLSISEYERIVEG